MLAGLLCSLYLILFVLGVGSNMFALIRTIKVYRWIRKCEWNSDSHPPSVIYGTDSSRVHHLISFSLIFIVTNLSLLLCLCFLISDVLAQGWHLGSALCWYYWWSENVSKTFVAFLLTAFSIERYLHSIHEPKWKLITNSSFIVVTLTIAAAVVVIVLAAPLQPYVGVQILTIEPAAAGFETTNLTKCGISEAIPKWSLRYHVVGSFVFAYVLPSVISIFCYMAISQNSKRTPASGTSQADPVHADERFPSLNERSISNTTTNSERPEPLSKRVTLIGASLAALYIMCWSPYWLTTMMIQFGNLTHASAFTLPFTLFVCHVLPYVNATAAGLLFLGLAKRLKLLKLYDVLSAGRPADPAEREAMAKGHYHEMATRESLASSDE